MNSKNIILLIHSFVNTQLCNFVITLVVDFFETPQICFDSTKFYAKLLCMDNNILFNFNNIDEKDARIMNPQVLAFVGDAVYSLYIRQRIVLTSNEKVKDLHSHVTNFVKASGQSNFIEKLLPLFNENEMSVFKRGRNYKTLSMAKNASPIDYKRATGLEAVFGYLYLSGQKDRLNELLDLSVGEKDEG